MAKYTFQKVRVQIQLDKDILSAVMFCAFVFVLISVNESPAAQQTPAPPQVRCKRMSGQQTYSFIRSIFVVCPCWVYAGSESQPEANLVNMEDFIT